MKTFDSYLLLAWLFLGIIPTIISYYEFPVKVKSVKSFITESLRIFIPVCGGLFTMICYLFDKWDESTK